MPKKDVLALSVLERCTRLPLRSCVAPLGPAVVGDETVEVCALALRECPLDEGWASFPWLLPMVSVKDVAGKSRALALSMSWRWS